MMDVTDKPTILVFEDRSKQLHRFGREDKSMTKMHRYPDHVLNMDFSAALLGEHVYVLSDDRSVYRVRHGQPTATWEKLSDWIGDHGNRPPVIVSRDAIFLVGAWSWGVVGENVSKSVSRFNPLLNKWEKINEKHTATLGSALACANECIYSFGGLDETFTGTNSAEILHLRTMKWSRVANMPRERYNASATEGMGKIYVVGGNKTFEKSSVEVYDHGADVWTDIKTVMLPDFVRLPFSQRSFHLDGILFIVGDDVIITYDCANDAWDVVSYDDGMIFENAVLVQ